jgi:2-methylcitrate dehydratase PrpD
LVSEDAIGWFADHVIATGFDDLGDDAIQAARTFVLDGLGVAAVGSAGPWVEPLIRTTEAQGSGADARVWVRGMRLPAAGAALVNAYQMHNSEFDCVHEAAVVHAMTQPLAVAMAEAERSGGIDGRSLITALAVGIDLAASLGVASKVPLRFFRPGTAGAFGALATLGKLRRFERATLINAFGALLAQLSGTMQAHREGGIMLALQMGFNARNAVLAADLAAAGLTAPQDVLEGRFGYFDLFEGEHDLESCLAILGKTWRIAELAHKPFPSGRATHGLLDGLLALQQAHGIAAGQVRKVVCRVPSLTRDLVGRPIREPMSVNYARLSAPYVLASALLGGGLTIEDFSTDALADERRLALGRKILVETDDNPDRDALAPVTVWIELEGGVVQKTTVAAVYGSPAKPLSRNAHLAKFRSNWAAAARPLPAADGERLIALVDRLEESPDVARLIDLLCPASSSGEA